MGVLIDSSILVQHARRRLHVAQVLDGLGEGDGFVAAVTASELLLGIHRAADPATRRRRWAAVEALLAVFPILPVDSRVVRVHAQLWAQLDAAGTPIGAHDLWIAATCLAHGHALVTADLRDFARLPGLVVHCTSRGE